jgi:hypothetical protein
VGAAQPAAGAPWLKERAQCTRAAPEQCAAGRVRRARRLTIGAGAQRQRVLRRQRADPGRRRGRRHGVAGRRGVGCVERDVGGAAVRDAPGGRAVPAQRAVRAPPVAQPEARGGLLHRVERRRARAGDLGLGLVGCALVPDRVQVGGGGGAGGSRAVGADAGCGGRACGGGGRGRWWVPKVGPGQCGPGGSACCGLAAAPAAWGARPAASPPAEQVLLVSAGKKAGGSLQTAVGEQEEEQEEERGSVTPAPGRQLPCRQAPLLGGESEGG